MKQQQFWKNPRQAHGGAQAKGKRKTARLIVTKQPLHVVFKSERAKGEWSFHRFKKPIQRSLEDTAKRFRIKVRLFQNVGNHLHLAIQGASRREIQNFLRVFAQAIAFLVTKTKKGKPIGRFWEGLVYTRPIHWGRDWDNVRQYFEKNAIESAGLPREIVDRIYAEVRVAWS